MNTNTLSRLSTGLICWVFLAGALDLAADSQKAFEVSYSAQRNHPSANWLSLITSPKKPIRDRVNTVHHLSRDLGVSEVQNLYAFLRAHPVSGENLPGLHYLKNEILTVLRSQAAPLPGLTDLMISICQDEQQDLPTRDYAVQHLALWCEEGAENQISGNQHIRNTFLKLAQQPTILAGTALLSLQRLSTFETKAQAEEVDSLALHMIEDKEAPDAAKMTAIAICGERKIMGGLPVLEGLVENPRIPFGLRISAIGALGQLGEGHSLSLLQQLRVSEKDPRLSPAIATALKRLDAEAASRGPL